MKKIIDKIFYQVNILLRACRLSIFDLKSSGSRSLIGFGWITLGFGIFIFAKSYLFANIFKDDIETYRIYLTSGLMTWYMISGLTTDGCNLYRNKGILKQILLPNNFFLYYFVFKRCGDFFLQSIILIIILIFASKFEIQIINFIFNFIFTLATFYYFMYNLAAIGMLSKDFGIMSGYALRIIFFLTPVFWKIDMIPSDLGLVYLINPYFHFLDLIRKPLIGEDAMMISYIFCFAFFILNFIIYKFFFKKLTQHYAIYI